MALRRFALYGSLLVVLAGWWVGLMLARHQPLGNDEFFSQVSSISGKSYLEIITGKIGEGNNSPLFYLLQKSFLDAIGYQVPDAWVKGRWEVVHAPSQILLRFNPVLFMALSIALIFYYFSRFYGRLAGIYSLFVSVSSYMVWAYWVEARPYALWVFLTTVQSFLFMHMVANKTAGKNIWNALILVHFLLALTVIFGLMQIVIVSALLWIFVERKWQKYILLMVIPVALCLFYYSHAPKYPFWFDLEPEQLIRASFSRDRFYILFIFAFYLLWFWGQKKARLPRVFQDDSILTGIPYLILTTLMLFAAFFVLFLFKLGDSHGEAGFPVSNRYFIYLTPIGIISATLLPVQLIKTFRGKWWMQGIIISGVGYLLVIRALKTYALIKGFYAF